MAFRCVLHENYSYGNWERDLVTIVFVISISPSQSTWYLHFYLNYGYHLPTLLEILQDVENTFVESMWVFT